MASSRSGFAYASGRTSILRVPTASGTLAIADSETGAASAAAATTTNTAATNANGLMRYRSAATGEHARPGECHLQTEDWRRAMAEGRLKRVEKRHSERGGTREEPEGRYGDWLLIRTLVTGS